MRHEVVIQLETNLDHLTGEELGHCLEALNNMPEVLDAIFLPGIGKKNRPSGLLRVLCHQKNEDLALAAVFRHTHSLGIRRQALERIVLARRPDIMECGDEILPAKSYELEGEQYMRMEADAARNLAYKAGKGTPALRLKKADAKKTKW